MTDPVITAVVTAYHPDERLSAVIDAALVTCADVVVVDNTPTAESSSTEGLSDPRVRVLRSGRNGGLAGALNDAVRALRPETEAVLVLDQDSALPEGVVAALAAHLADPSIGVVAPTPVDAADGSTYERFSPRGTGLVDQDTVITSGMLVRRTVLEAAGPFRDEFFVDWVDNDFCLRLRRDGVRIVQDLATRLPHSIGDRREHRIAGLTVKVLRYSPWRHYWITRNGLVMIRENLVRHPRWSLMAVLYIGRQAVTTALFEPSRGDNVKAILSGVRDALRNRVTPRYLPAGADYRSGAQRSEAGL
ncbi:rhamnosyltransferase [Lentzea xinjiangensis]|uniref:Rhamnosyltransferase n=1 Tax=Lentzea xinjiangensis TaxID=402600 RepID=A0A1H8ZI47_9PSEU|nr:glycosyltransferase [Lentzea xinjiangensis]SEP64209.1 rhamnosyltransferase [Lentzea xinjiangensis]